MLESLIIWIKATSLHHYLISNAWAFPTAETLHFMGLTLLFGALLIIDLRGLGLIKKFPLAVVHKFVPIVLIAFAINLITGILFIFADPDRYFINIAFQYKMVLIFLAGINALAFEFLIFRPIEAGQKEIENGVLIKVSSGLSILIWTLVIVGGRMIPYVET